MVHRGLLEDGPAVRLAAFLADTDTVRADGTIPEALTMLKAYAARARVSIVTAWADLRRLVTRGLVRQVQGAAPGIKARYRLSAPVAMIRAHMPGLPPDLVRALYRNQPEPADDEQERQGGDPDSGVSCEGLNTSPSTREGSPPAPGRPDPSQGQPPVRTTRQRGSEHPR